MHSKEHTRKEGQTENIEVGYKRVQKLREVRFCVSYNFNMSQKNTNQNKQVKLYLKLSVLMHILVFPSIGTAFVGQVEESPTNC